MSFCDNTTGTINQETLLKLQSIRKTKTCSNPCKKTFNDPRIRRSTAVLYEKSTDGTAHHCLSDPLTNHDFISCFVQRNSNVSK